MALHPDCLAELGLEHAPFDTLPNEEFVYSDVLLEEMIATAGDALASPGAILLLTGPGGSGRSMQLMRLLGVLPDNYELIAFRARPNTKFEAVDFTIRNHLRAAGHDDPDRALTDLLAERIREGSDPVIAVDDAHLLGTDIVDQLLRMRSEILIAEGRGPRLILTGDPVLLRRRLHLRPVDEDQVVRISLRPFSLEQTGAYLRHRLRAAGRLDPDTLLSDDDIADLQARSRGLPGALNTHANEWLERYCRTRDGRPAPTLPVSMPDSPQPEPAAAAFTASGLATDADAELKTEPRLPDSGTGPAPADKPAASEPFPADAPPQPQARGLAADREDEPAPDPPVHGQPEPAVPPRTDGATESGAPAYGHPDPAPPPRAGDEAGSGTPLRADDDRGPRSYRRESERGRRDAAVPFWNRSWFVPAVALVVAILILAPFARHIFVTPAPPEGSTVELPLPTPPRAATPERDDAVGSQAQPPGVIDVPFDDRPTAALPSREAEPPAPAPTPEAAPTAEPEPAPTPEPAPPPTPAPVPETAPEPRPEVVPAPPAEPTGLAADREWLGRQNRSHVTIQLVAASDLAAARNYVTRYELSGIRYIETRSGGRNFVVALAGSFADRAAAENALRNLPAAVRADQPWIRSLGSVQDSQR
ncbi:Sporulation domain-containing protein [Thioalkalivibrio nitratireducens DSM 14787]|uniref:Sporulation domain-containing protein n=1 Tax=Thioalkalivibrio nitratireducens (strain DSM 14787 / UNIQEM 213 / ALEN2) TaxID=1255043 RepID=L0E3A2_THIND|nr:SPOR domain-containing protein [Thioalkalivibrio nitratireducens]AGA35116.1 Sporulation domain-containing protein [Thioalkalivibrio nitratireducens DSM 14787]